MKRYNITADISAEAVTVPSGALIKIDESLNGEWVRYEDACMELDKIKRELGAKIAELESYLSEEREKNEKQVQLTMAAHAELAEHKK